MEYKVDSFEHMRKKLSLSQKVFVVVVVVVLFFVSPEIITTFY